MTPLLSNQLLRTQSDDRLTALAVAGHDRAFEAIVDRYRKPLQRYLRRLLSEALAEDVLQATFVRAWQALGGGTQVRDLRPWLYRIAHNQAVNALRAASVALPDGPELVDARGTVPTLSTEGEVERREELRQTLDDIGALPDRQRAALVAVAVADRPHADVAAELGLSDGALRQLLLRARTALRATATAITPYPLVGWLSAGQEVSATRVAEVAAGAGGAGLGLKAGAAVLAAGAVVAGAPALRDEHPPARVTPSTTTQATHAAAATLIDDHAGSAQARPLAAARSTSGGRTSANKQSAHSGTVKGSSSGSHPSAGSGSGSGDDGGHSGRGGGDDSSGSGSSGSGSGSSDSGSGSASSSPRHGSRDDGGEDRVAPSSGGESSSSGDGSGDSSGSGESSSSGDGASSDDGVVTPVPTQPPTATEGDSSGHGNGSDLAPSGSSGD